VRWTSPYMCSISTAAIDNSKAGYSIIPFQAIERLVFINKTNISIDCTNITSTVTGLTGPLGPGSPLSPFS